MDTTRVTATAAVTALAEEAEEELTATFLKALSISRNPNMKIILSCTFPQETIRLKASFIR